MLRLDAAGLSFSAPSGGQASLTDGSHFIFGARAGVRWQFTRAFCGLASLSYGSEPFATAVATNRISLDALFLCGASVAADYLMWQRAAWHMGVSIGGAVRFSGGTDRYAVRAGTILQGGIFGEVQRPDNAAWRVEAGYAQRSQNTTLIMQDDKSLQVGVIYRWPLSNLAAARPGG